MKKLILISLLSLLISVHLYAGDPYKVRTEVFELEVTKVIDIVPYEIVASNDKSLKITAKTSEIIDYLYPQEIESELDFDQMYKIEVNSDKNIDDIKQDILYHFLKAVGLNISYKLHEQTKYILSYTTDLKACEAQLSESKNSSTKLNIQFKKRVLLKGLSLQASVESLNNALKSDIFEAGESDLVALPKMYFLKSKLENDPVEYLKAKGFEVEEVIREIEIPVLVYSE